VLYVYCMIKNIDIIKSRVIFL